MRKEGSKLAKYIEIDIRREQKLKRIAERTKKYKEKRNNMRKFEYVTRVTPNLDLPKRATKNSAGYDFVNIEKVTLQPLEIKLVKTGVKVKLLEDEFLMLCNRSSNPIKKGLILANSVGIVDSDYYNNAENEGEIGFMFMNIKQTPVTIEVGEKLGQGIFMKYAKVDNDNVTDKRISGWGSTGA